MPLHELLPVSQGLICNLGSWKSHVMTLAYSFIKHNDSNTQWIYRYTLHKPPSQNGCNVPLRGIFLNKPVNIQPNIDFVLYDGRCPH